MGVLSGNPKDEPMHYGEVFSLWSFVLAGKGAVAGFQTALNHAGDTDLQKLIEEVIVATQEDVKKVEMLLKENGVGLAPTPAERPKADLDHIPAGARMQDPEIAATLSADLAAGLVVCSGIMGQSTREDIAMMFGQFHMQKAALGAKALKLNKEKGWLVLPPLHQGRPESN